MEFVDDIYETLIGVRAEEFQVPGVENAFWPGTYCAQRYAHLNLHRQRLWERLWGEDEDLEEILSAMESIQQELCFKMFEYGRTLP